MSLKRPSHRIVPISRQWHVTCNVWVSKPADTALTSALMIAAFPNMLTIESQKVPVWRDCNNWQLRYQHSRSSRCYIKTASSQCLKYLDPNLEARRPFRAQSAAHQYRGKGTCPAFYIEYMLNVRCVTTDLNQSICFRRLFTYSCGPSSGQTVRDTLRLVSARRGDGDPVFVTASAAHGSMPAS